MDDLKKGMEYLKTDLNTNLTNFLQEMLTIGERVVKETHDENKINVNHDFIDSNVRLKNHHVPNIDIRKFDGKYLRKWILQMEQFFDIHNVQNTQKVRIANLYSKPNQFVWYRWLLSRKQIFTLAIFMDQMIAHYVDTKSNTFLAN